jgi:hypothetical protein
VTRRQLLEEVDHPALKVLPAEPSCRSYVFWRRVPRCSHALWLVHRFVNIIKAATLSSD